METWEECEAERDRLKAAYGSLYESVLEALFRHDPICINYGNNTDEYEPEVGTILPRLETCRSPGDVLTVVHEEFRRWFDDIAGPRERYGAIAEELWRLWQERRGEGG